MSQVSYEQADHVAQQVSDELGSPHWLRGVGVEPDANEGYVVSVRVADENAVHLPERMDGVRIRVKTRGLPWAFTSSSG
jgi:hypothetical protein